MSHPPIPLPTPLPDGLVPFASEAIQSFRNKAIIDIEFSGPTYHVRCLYKEASEWVFVQLNSDHTPQDIFCGCEECSKNGYCIHMAIALIGIFNATDLPLHIRFIRSPFYSFCREQQVTAVVQRDDSKLIVGPIVCTGSVQKLEKVIIKNEEQTEENSIKFSNCTDEELRLWGLENVSERLAFELSPLTDLCKYIFTISEQQECSWSFACLNRLIPDTVTIHLREISCTAPIPSDVQRFLDSLLFHKTNLQMHHFGGKSIQKIEYEPTTSFFSIALSGEEIDLQHALNIPNSSWWYIANIGFVRKLSPELHTHLPIDNLTFFLDATQKEQHIEQIHYTISFSPKEGLRIVPYVHSPRDLSQAIVFGIWIWQEPYGFLRLEPSQVPIRGVRIPLERIPEFIENHSHFLCTQNGFSVFSSPPNSQFSYTVDHSGAVTFSQQASKDSSEKAIEFENWVFVPNTGFYPKQGLPPIPFDVPISPHKIASYISKNQRFLETVPNFFSTINPIKETVLSLTFTKNQIVGQPTYIWTTSEYKEKAFSYGTFGYIDSLGFFPLPTGCNDHSLEFSIDIQDRDAWETFFLDKLPLLLRDCTCIIDPSLVPPVYLNLVCQNAIDQIDLCPNSSKNRNFDVSFTYQSEKGVVTAKELIALSKKTHRFAPTKAGLIDLSDPRFTWLATLRTQQHNQPYQLKHYDFLKISTFDHIHFDETTAKETREALHRLIYGLPIVKADFSALHSSLRPYQHDGVEWLWNLYLNGLSGLLCDDMGVGKTHQALGLVASVSQLLAEKKEKPRFLIICPTSLIWHWENKVHLLLPHLRICMYVGIERSESTLACDYDVLITTYGTWRNDVTILDKIYFEIVIFDELQIAKNHISQIWSALTKVSSRMRIGLTGTPIENSLRELKALFDLILPGYFPKEKLFKNSTILTKGLEFRSIIAAYAKPFVLRRRKQDVLQELPVKTENVLSVDLLPEQRELYRKVASRETSAILTMLENAPTIIPYMHIFALLLALKHICNHPATYAKDIENYEAYSSGKWEAFQELLEEAINSGQKVVVFSHSLAMLDIMEMHLTKKGLHFAQIRGSTKNRKDQLEHFQNNPKCKVFLASLMAAGLGIDLTAASVVIHYDRWWNAARENQATDRVHRLGQSRGVMVYKLMTTKTIEERIDKIIAGKSSLLEDVLSYDDHRIIKQLSRQELVELLKGIDAV